MKLFSDEAEQHLIACALIDESAVPSLLEIPDDWFYKNENKLIYRSIGELSSQGLSCDSFSVGEHLNRKQALEMAGGMEYIAGLAESLPSLGMFNSFKSTLLTYYKVRQLNNIRNSLEQQLETNAKPADVAEWLSQQTIDLMTDHHNGGLEKAETFLGDVIEEMEWREQNPGRLMGQATGFNELDFVLDGIKPGVYNIAGRPGSGKTAYALELAKRLTQNQKPWPYFSQEMTGKALSKRMVLSVANMSNHHFRRGRFSQDDFAAIGKGIGAVQDRTLYIDETPAISLQQMRSRLKAFKMKHGQIGGFFVDHIGLMRKDPRKSDTEAMNMIADGLLELSKEFECPVIQLCQLNRGVESRSDKRPIMSDLKQSGKIEENADVIIMLYRDDYYDPDAAPITEVIIAKNRDGETKTLYFKHDMSCGKYEELPDYKPPIEEKKGMRL